MASELTHFDFACMYVCIGYKIQVEIITTDVY